MRIIGVSDSMVLQETEKIEHTLSNETSGCIEMLNDFFASNADIANRFEVYKTEHK
jgi:Mn-dependent DtxR family transcriptional regulator